MTKLNKLFESKNSALIFKSKNTKKKQENRKENKKIMCYLWRKLGAWFNLGLYGFSSLMGGLKIVYGLCFIVLSQFTL